MRASRVWARAPRLTRHPHFSRLNQGNPLRRENPLVSRALIWRGSVEPGGERFESDSFGFWDNRIWDRVKFEIDKSGYKWVSSSPLKSFAFSLEKQNKGGESRVLVWDGFAMVYLTNKQGKGQCCCGLFKAIRLLPRTPTAGPISFFRTDCVIIWYKSRRISSWYRMRNTILATYLLGHDMKYRSADSIV